MATISCKCDTCKRQIEIPENTHGLTIIGRCTITLGCRGKLRQVVRNPNTARGANTPILPGVDNYIPRQAFYQHVQALSSNKWRVVHGLGVMPTILLYVLNHNGEYVIQNGRTYHIEVIDENSVNILFDRDMVGIAHCIAKSSVPVSIKQLPVPEDTTQLSTKGVLTLAVPRFLTRPSVPADLHKSFPVDLCWSESHLRVEVEVTFPNAEPIVCIDSLDNVLDNRSPWTGWNSILIEGRRNYCLKSLNIANLRTFRDGDYHIDDIPDGTRVRFLRIDYGSGTPQKIYSRGLMGMVSDRPYDYIDKRRDRIVDIGEMTGADDGYFTYIDGEFHLANRFVEITYPLIDKTIAIVVPPQPTPTPTPTVTSSIPPTPTTTATPAITPTLTRTPMMTMTVTPIPPSNTPAITPTVSTTPAVTPTPSLITYIIDGQSYNEVVSTYDDSFSGGDFLGGPYTGFDGGGFA